MVSPVNILLVTVLSSIMSTALLGSLRFAQLPGIHRWMCASLLWAGSMALVTLQNTSCPGILTIVMANIGLGLASILIYEGCRQFQGLLAVTMLPYIGLAVLFCGLCYWLYLSPDFNARVALMSAFHAILYLSIGWVVWRRRPSSSRATYCYGFFLIAALVGTLGHGFRSVVYLLGEVHQTELLQATPINVTFLALGTVVLPFLSIGMVMLAHERLAEQLRRWANIDAMTGALVRRAFIERVNPLLARATSEALPISMAIVDIDYFKMINDEYGHVAGDQVLAHIGRLISANLRETDLFGRIGGEEFGILFVNTERQDAVARVDALRQVLAQDECEIQLAQERKARLGCTFSAGVDEYRRGETLSNLMARVDGALYEAKSLGRNRVVDAQAQVPLQVLGEPAGA